MRRPRFLPLLVLLLCISLPAFAQKATMEGESRMSWPFVRGGLDGNPVVSAATDLVESTVIRDRFPQTPRWLVSGDLNGDRQDEAIVLFADGTLQILYLEKDRFRSLDQWNGLSPEAPPVFVASAGRWTGPGVLAVDDRGDLSFHTPGSRSPQRLASGISALTEPAVADLDGDGQTEMLAVGEGGSLVLLYDKSESLTDTSANLLPDSRITVADLNGDGRLEAAVLAHPKERVKVGRLGDETEPQGIAVYTWDGTRLKMENEFKLEGKDFFETLSPLAADLDKEPGKELILPVTKAGEGSAVCSFSYAPRLMRKLKEGPRVDGPKSFYQVLGMASLGDQTRPGILAVSGPEGQGTLEILRTDLAGTRLGTADGITTHFPGSRTMGLALIGDFDGSGKLSLLAPGKDASTLRLFTFSGGALVYRQVYNDKSISSNLCPGDFNGDGKPDLAFGCQNGTLYVLLGR